MRARCWKPAGPLSAHVERVWGWESTTSVAGAMPLVLPGTGADVFIHYRAPFRATDADGTIRNTPAAHLICARRKPMALQTQGAVGFIAIRFRAGGLYRFTNAPADMLADSTLPVEALWGAAGRALADEVSRAAGWEQRVEAVKRFLSGRLTVCHADDLVERAVRHLYYGCASTPVARLARTLGIGTRQLERRVRSVTGQSPVEIRTASRFQKIMRRMLLHPSDDFLTTILRYGFYDQAHFARTCRSFGLPSPQRTLAMARTMSHFYNPPPHGPASV
jgi:AraC-like DNA-binding protein